MNVSCWNLKFSPETVRGTFWEKHNFFWDLQFSHVRQQVEVRSKKSDRQGQVDRFCEVFPPAVSQGTPPTKLLIGGISWNVEFPPMSPMSPHVDRQGKNSFDPGSWHLYLLPHVSGATFSMFFKKLAKCERKLLKSEIRNLKCQIWNLKSEIWIPPASQAEVPQARDPKAKVAELELLS